MHRSLAGLLARALPGIKKRVALIPKLFGDDRRNCVQNPIVLGFECPLLSRSAIFRVVRSMDAFGGWVLNEPVNRCVTPFGAVAGAETAIIQNARDRLLPAMLCEKFVD